MPQIRIDPEFQNKIPPLTEAEFKQLEENILEAGRIYEPLVIWEQTGIIVDGHNRYKILLKHAAKGEKIKHEIRLMPFADKWEAFDWMYKNQLGRRNLTEEQKAYLLGKQYEARKHYVGEHKGNQYTKMKCGQSDAIPKGRVREQIAAEHNIGTRTVDRAGAYAKGIDVIRQTDSDYAESILKGETKVSSESVQAIGRCSAENVQSAINSLKEGKPITGKRGTVEAKAIARALTDESITMDFTLDHLIEQMRYNADGFVNSLSNLLMDHKDISNNNRAEIVDAINTIIIDRVNQIKERLNNGAQL